MSAERTELGAAPTAVSAGIAANPSCVRESIGSTTAFNRTTVLPRKARGDTAAEAKERPRYERVRRLGEGGMGEVALARDVDIGRRVAVKRLRATVNSEAAVLRFADEVRVIGRLEHPAIVPVYDVGVGRRGPALRRDEVRRGTLEKVIERLEAGDPAALARFSHEYRIRIFLTIVQAVRYAHDQGIIHHLLRFT